MTNIHAYAEEKVNNIVIGNNSLTIAYNLINEQNDNCLNKIQEEEYYFNTKNQKVYLVSNNLEKSISLISSLKGKTLIYMDSFLEENGNILELSKKFAQELLIHNYEFNELKTNVKIEEKDFYLTTLLKIDYQSQVNEGVIIGKAVHNSRRLVDLPLNHLNAVHLGNYALKMKANNDNLNIKVLGLEEIKKLNMGAFLAVNQGSYIEPRLIELSYYGIDNHDDFIQLIGKGLTFDTGGYSLKGNMINMKSDMTGASIVLSVIEAVAKLKLPVNLKALVLATDNKLSSNSIVPDDVITSMSGKTIEIVSTDAEGRLTLCDALTYSIKNNAKKIIDIATLTGSAVSTFGSQYTACFTNNQEFLNSLNDVCKRNNEKLWQLPLDDNYFKGLKSLTADMKNSGPRVAGASVAAIFLKQFIEKDTKWIHLDIAGTATQDNGSSTGVLVKSLIDYFSSI